MTPAAIISAVASLQNDTAQTQYTTQAVLPYFNMALDELQEIMEENNIPTTNQATPSFLSILANPNPIVIGYTTAPPLPAGLIEIQRIWESNDGGNTWTPMVRKDFISQNLNTLQLSSFGIFAWLNQEIHLPPIATNVEVKLEYIQSIFATPITIEQADTDLGVQYTNIKSYLQFATGALCAEFIGENPERAGALAGKAEIALERAMNIPTKGRQAIATRRRPFRANYKTRGWY